MGASALDWLVNSLALQLEVIPNNHNRIQQYIDVLFDYLKESSASNSRDASEDDPRAWKGQLLLKCSDQEGISWERIRWIEPKDTFPGDSTWIYRFPVEGQDPPELEIARTIQTFLQLLVLEGYSIINLSATVKLEEGPNELLRPRNS